MNSGSHNLTICIKGAGEMATGVAWRLYQANLRRIFMLECPRPLAVRRGVSFCEAVYEGAKEVEAVEAVCCQTNDDIHGCWQGGKIAVVVDPLWRTLGQIRTHVVVDAILAKKNSGTDVSEAELVVGLGPGFASGQNVHMVVETKRGHDLGRIITSGSAAANTGVPGSIGGFTGERVLRAPAEGQFRTLREIGEQVKRGEVVGEVAGENVIAAIDGVLRGLIRPGSKVQRGLKIGDIDPRGIRTYCYTISDKARAVGGSVLEAVLRVFPL